MGSEPKLLDRRSLIGGSLIAGLPMAATARTVGANALDLTKPEDNVKAIVKIQGDLSGKTTYSWGHGHIFGVVDGQMATPMLQYQSMRVARYFPRDGASYLFAYRGAIFYQDYETGEYIDEFTNPFTQQTVKVKHWKSSIGRFLYTPQGPKAAANFKRNVGKDYTNRPYLLPWLRGGDRVWVMLDERIEYERPSDGVWRRDNAILRLETPWEELMDPERTSSSASTSFQTDIDWFTWLGMPGHAGSLMQGGLGRKFASLGDLPASFVTFAESRYPGILTDPISAA